MTCVIAHRAGPVRRVTARLDPSDNMQARTPYRPCMPQPDDHPDSIARRLIEALAATRGSPKAVLDECRELRAWDPEQLDTLMQAFDAEQTGYAT